MAHIQLSRCFIRCLALRKCASVIWGRASAKRSYGPESDSREWVSTFRCYSLAHPYRASFYMILREENEKKLPISCKNLFFIRCKKKEMNSAIKTNMDMFEKKEVISVKNQTYS